MSQNHDDADHGQGGLLAKVGLSLGLCAAAGMLLFGDLQPGKPQVTATAAVALLMAIWWITEALPLAVTALVPIVLFPALGVMDGKAAADQYFNHIVTLFIGGFVVALAMQRWNLHRRIALRLLLFFGVAPSRILLGFMVATAFLSMWISNTAATMMMVTIAVAMVARVEDGRPTRHSRRFAIGLLLGVAYGASIGGIGTLVGTPPNMVFVQILRTQFPGSPEISFASWFAFAVPISVSFLLLTWLFLRWLYVPKQSDLDIDLQLIRQQYVDLGRLSFAEWVVLADFIALVLLWLTRADIDLGDFTIPGWSGLFGDRGAFFNDGTVAVAMAVLLYAIPARDGRGRRVMDWGATAGLPWGIVLLFGGGFALAAGFAHSDLDDWLGKHLTGLRTLDPILVVAIVCLAISFLTELTSNVATTGMILPVMAGLAIAIQVNPLFLMVPVTISCSCAFMMPVATPPNAIVFGSGRLRVADMARTGVILNVVGMLLIVTFTWLLGDLVLGIDLGEMPAWAQRR